MLRGRAPSLDASVFVVPGIDPMNAHWPCYCGAVLRHRGGPDGFFTERQRRIDASWRAAVDLLPTLRALPSLPGPAAGSDDGRVRRQRVLIFDLESSHVPSSLCLHQRKATLPPELAERLVHCTIAASVNPHASGRRKLPSRRGYQLPRSDPRLARLCR